MRLSRQAQRWLLSARRSEQVRSTMLAGARGRTVEHLGVMMWRGYEAESDAVRTLRVACAQLGFRGKLECDVKISDVVFELT